MTYSNKCYNADDGSLVLVLDNLSDEQIQAAVEKLKGWYFHRDSDDPNKKDPSKTFNKEFINSHGSNRWSYLGIYYLWFFNYSL